MLAPIALYPDALLTHILIATTYPIEVVDAERWLSKNNQLSAQALADAADDMDWDASVKALLPFPTILKKLSEDLHWMRNLGDAFLQDEAQVLMSVQALRQNADQAGNLSNMDNVKIVRETKTIIIEPREPEVIYVPYYDTRVVYGHWRWSHYPPIFWHRPARYASHHGPYYWHNPVHLGLGLFFGAVHWNNRHVVVHHHKSRYYKHHGKKKRSTSYQAKRWQHNPRHRKGVAYRSSQIQKKYRSHTPSVQKHRTVRAQQKQYVNKNKHVAKHSSRKHENLKQKMQENRAVKVDKHQIRKDARAKTTPYKDPKWRNNKVAPHVDKRRVKSVKPSPKQYIDKPRVRKETVRKTTVQKHKQTVTHHKQSAKSHRKPVNAQKSTYQKSKSTKSVKREHKRSHAKASSSRKSHGARTQYSRAKKHN